MEQTTRPFREILDKLDGPFLDPLTGKVTPAEARTRPDTQASADCGPISRPIADILAERWSTHGDFTDHAAMTQALKRLMRSGMNWETLSDVQKESLEMNAHKIGRILSGNPDHHDHWDDIAGYAKLVSERI